MSKTLEQILAFDPAGFQRFRPMIYATSLKGILSPDFEAHCAAEFTRRGWHPYQGASYGESALYYLEKVRTEATPAQLAQLQQATGGAFGDLQAVTHKMGEVFTADQQVLIEDPQAQATATAELRKAGIAPEGNPVLHLLVLKQEAERAHKGDVAAAARAIAKEAGEFPADPDSPRAHIEAAMNRKGVDLEWGSKRVHEETSERRAALRAAMNKLEGKPPLGRAELAPKVRAEVLRRPVGELRRRGGVAGDGKSDDRRAALDHAWERREAEEKGPDALAAFEADSEKALQAADALEADANAEAEAG